MTAANDGAPCIDGDPCSQDSSCVGGTCEASGPSICQCKVDADCAASDDGNVCNGVAFCDTSAFPWQCGSKEPVKCNADADTECSKNTCQPATGKCLAVAVQEDEACDDGDNCTVGDVCKAGTCAAGPVNACFCTKQADCEAKEDGDLCNGVLYCDLPKGESKGECKIVPATVVQCPTVDDATCEKNTCDPKVGKCSMQLVKPGTPCDDGDACTGGEICVGGVCGQGNNICPCKQDADCAAQDDGDLCNGTLYCDKLAAKCLFDPSSIVSCASVNDSACDKNVCLPKTGKCALTAVEETKPVVCEADGAACAPCADTDQPGCHFQPLQPGEKQPKKGAFVCSDGDACTTGDVCAGGKCVPGTFTCKCTDDASCVAEDDGDLCNGKLFCNKAKSPAVCELNPATVISCPSVDDTTCVKNTCEPKLGKCFMLPAANGAACSDGEACTKNDVCIAGKCSSGAMICECISNADCKTKDDGNLCNGVPYCGKDADGKAKCLPNPASVVYCPKNNDTACIKSSCDPITGNCSLKPGAEGKPCEDGSACTVATACKDGECLGNKVDCDDKNQCTADTCLAVKGCQHDKANCDDSQTCTVDSCDPETGKCTFTPAATGAPCDADDSGCTVNDHCADGACKAGLPAECELKVEACQEQACQSVSATSFKCIKIAANDGALCDDGVLCSLGGACKTGKCQTGQGARYYLSQLSAKVDGKDLNLRVHAVAATVTGYVLAGHGYTGNYPEQPQAGWLWARAVDRSGTKILWEKLLAVDNPAEPGAWFDTVRVLANGEVLLAGGDNMGNGVDAVMARYDASGKALWPDPKERKTWDGGSGSNDGARAVVAFPGGGYALAGYAKGGTHLDRSATVRRISGSGSSLWFKSVGGELLNEVSDATLSTDGALVTAGWRDAGENTGSGWLSRWDAAGNQDWSEKFVITGGGRFHALQALPDGGFAAAGQRRTSGGKDSWWLVRTTAKGVKIWEANGQTNGGAFGLGRNATGGFDLVGWANPTAASPDIWLAGVDGQGNKHWQRVVEVGGEEQLSALAMDSDGSLIAVGHTVAQGAGGGASKGLLVRADPWGHTDCAKSGDCAKLKATACEDGESCTVDDCDPVKGCVKPSLDDASACADGKKCSSGVCG